MDVSPSWTGTPTGGMIHYAYGGEYTAPGLQDRDTAPLWDRTDAESQDSGFDGTRNMEIDIKEHGIEGCSATPEPRAPVGNERTDQPRSLITRDPRARQVSVAGPSRLYGRAGTPMINPQNIALTDPAEEASIPSDGEDKLVIVLGDE